MVPGADPGISLYVRNKRLSSMNSFTQDNVVLFVHGATYPAETGFDLQLDGTSWMDVLVRQGFDVYLVNIRGYGKSTRPPEMDRPPLQNKPVVNSDMAARDFAAAADWVRGRRLVPKLNVIGHSWGMVITGLYCSRQSEKVQRLVLYAPVWLRQTASLLTEEASWVRIGKSRSSRPASARRQAWSPVESRSRTIGSMHGRPPLSRPIRRAPGQIQNIFALPMELWKMAAITGTRASLFTTPR